VAVSIFYGMTESGKTYLAEKMIAQFSRAIIFDFTGKMNAPEAYITSDFSPNGIMHLFKKFKDHSSYKIIFRPGRVKDVTAPFNKVAVFALALGRAGIKKGLGERIVLLIDEADFVCSSSYQSPELKEVVNVGRHDNVDSWFISRIPQRLHTDARSNASKIYCFRLTDDSALGFLRKAIGKKAAEKVKTLNQYSFLHWKDTGEIFIFDKNQKQIESWR
jgi:hypothetical protein